MVDYGTMTKSRMFPSSRILCIQGPRFPGSPTKGPGNIGTLPLFLFSEMQLDRSQLGAMSNPGPNSDFQGDAMHH